MSAEENALSDYQALAAVANATRPIITACLQLIDQVKELEPIIGQHHRARLECFACDAMYQMRELEADARGGAAWVLERYVEGGVEEVSDQRIPDESDNSLARDTVEYLSLRNTVPVVLAGALLAAHPNVGPVEAAAFVREHITNRQQEL